MRRIGVVVAVGWVALGCGGQAGVDLARRERPAPSPDAGQLRDAGGPDAAAAPPPFLPTEPGKEPPPFEDPGCPPASAAPIREECDPLASPSGCPIGQSCFPFVRYPTGPCEVEQYGTACLPAGPGTQGDSCSRQACAAEHICVSTGRGTQCARICSFEEGAANVCAPGLLCLPIDIEGFGGCL